MNLFLVAAELNPYSRDTARGVEIERLARALGRGGDHDVTVVLPLPVGLAPDEFPLARRLSPLRFEVEGEEVSCVRYDGRTAAGIDAILLDVDGLGLDPGTPATAKQLRRYTGAVLCLLGSLAQPPEWCVCCADAAPELPRLAREQGDASAGILQLMVVDGPCVDADALSHGVAAANKVLVDAGAGAQALEDRIEPLATMIEEGRAPVFPRAVARRGAADPDSKASARAALQLELGLPVRRDVPVILVQPAGVDDLTAALGALLTRDVQVIVDGGGNGVEDLAERFPDRLAPAERPLDDPVLLAGADGCLAGRDPRLAAAALARGAVPVAAGPGAVGLVDLEESLESGNGVILPDLGAAAVAAGLGRVVAGFALGEPFGRLAARLPGLAPTWDEQADRCLQLMDEIPRTATAG